MAVLSGQVNKVQYLQPTQASTSKKHPMERKSNFYSSKINIQKWVATSRDISMLCWAKVQSIFSRTKLARNCSELLCKLNFACNDKLLHALLV